MRTARAKGVSETWVVLKHGLRNAMIPVVTMMGLQFGFLLGGSIVVEKVFNWPGLGRLLVDSVEMRDYPVIQAEVLLSLSRSARRGMNSGVVSAVSAWRCLRDCLSCC